MTYAEGNKTSSAEDKWDSWVINVSGNGYFNGEKSIRSSSLNGSFSANRATPDIKIQLACPRASATISSSTGRPRSGGTGESFSFSGLVVKSLDEHLSVGGYLSASSPTYGNILFDLCPAPAVEYDVFPYSQSTRRPLQGRED